MPNFVRALLIDEEGFVYRVPSYGTQTICGPYDNEFETELWLEEELWSRAEPLGRFPVDPAGREAFRDMVVRISQLAETREYLIDGEPTPTPQNTQVACPHVSRHPRVSAESEGNACQRDSPENEWIARANLGRQRRPRGGSVQV